ncbi:hypothetical protein EDWATA_02110, partial [Edwardsiella tarda ATCC 23685]
MIQVNTAKARLVAREMVRVRRAASEMGRRRGLRRIGHLKHVAYTAHRLDQLRLEVEIDFG